MRDIGNLYGISPDEVRKMRRAGINTVEDFEALVGAHFVYRIAVLANITGIWKPERLIELMTPEKLPAEQLPEQWIDGLMARVLREAKSEEPWMKRCRSGLERWRLNLKGHWRGWRENLKLLLGFSVMMAFVGLGLRAVGLMKGLPPPFGLRDEALVTTRNLKEGHVLKASDLYGALLPSERDYFKTTDRLEGFMLASSLAERRPLRHKDVLRLQVTAKADIPSCAIIREADLEVKWGPYQPDAIVHMAQAIGREAQYEIKQGTIIPCFMLAPSPCAQP